MGALKQKYIGAPLKEGPHACWTAFDGWHLFFFKCSIYFESLVFSVLRIDKKSCTHKHEIKYKKCNATIQRMYTIGIGWDEVK